MTNIYTTKKLEKIVSNYISNKESTEENNLGSWSANVFFISHKKCWLLVNKVTKYALVLSDMKQSNLNNINKIFTQTFYEQLLCDGIKINSKSIENIIGEVKLLKTDGDRSTIAFMNYYFLYIEDWKFEYRSFDNLPFRELNSRLNSIPTKALEWKEPKFVMSEILKKTKS